MIALIVTLSLLLTWLLHETQWLRVRLPQYAPVSEQVPQYSGRSDMHELARRIGWTFKSNGYYQPVKEWLLPICGWEWIAEHEHDLDEYKPTVSIKYDGFKAVMHIEDLSIIKGLVHTITRNYKHGQLKRRKHIDLARVSIA